MAKKKLSRDQKRKQKKKKARQRKQRQAGGSKMPRKVLKPGDEEYERRVAAAAERYAMQEARIMQVFGVDDEEEIPRVDENTLQSYGRYLETRLQLPCLLTGIESIGYFGWEERFEFGYGNKAEYARLRKERGSLKDQYLLETFEAGVESDGWEPDLVVNVKRTDDGKQFSIPLSELKAVDQSSDNYVLLNDFTVWKVNW